MDTKKILNMRTVFGLIILAFGVLLLLGSFDILDTSDMWSKGWPIILILVGIVNVVNRGNSKVFGISLIIIGIFYELKVLGIFFEDISIWQLIWPVAIIVIGLYLIIPRKPMIITNGSTSNSATAIFSGSEIRVTASDFSGGEATAVFGGVDIDLREADFDPSKPPVLDVFAAFGGIDIKVPEDWFVETKGVIILGGMDNKKKNKGTQDMEVLPRKVLYVKYFGMFGGIDIK